LDLLLKKDLGFNYKNNLQTKLFFRLPYNSNWKKLSDFEKKEKRKNYLASHQYLINKLTHQPSIQTFSQGSSILKPYNGTYKCPETNNEFTTIKVLYTNEKFDKVYNLKTLKGRFFDEKIDNILKSFHSL
jgi:hypothetical protein